MIRSCLNFLVGMNINTKRTIIWRGGGLEKVSSGDLGGWLAGTSTGLIAPRIIYNLLQGVDEENDFFLIFFCLQNAKLKFVFGRE